MQSPLVSLLLVLGLTGAPAWAGDAVEKKKEVPAVKRAKPAAPPGTIEAAGETDAMKMQKHQDRHAKATETLSNTMKKSSETSDSVIKNTK